MELQGDNQPMLIISRHTALSEESQVINGIEQSHKIVVKNQPFNVDYRLANPGTMTMKQFHLETCLVFDEPSLKPVGFIRQPPLDAHFQLRPNALEVIGEFRISVLSSQNVPCPFNDRKI